jgi:hypothetical protein
VGPLQKGCVTAADGWPFRQCEARADRGLKLSFKLGRRDMPGGLGKEQPCTRLCGCRDLSKESFGIRQFMDEGECQREIYAASEVCNAHGVWSEPQN